MLLGRSLTCNLLIEAVGRGLGELRLFRRSLFWQDVDAIRFTRLLSALDYPEC
ncbi:hypothetical protein [Klebsiella aerogenes]|uniref:hypothetical protein n=1 Tax=Klebsiella aerogenes TaxID=548 RepID=UPI00178C457B|nr:hypothetical protein [Klebsiella aerogenes]